MTENRLCSSAEWVEAFDIGVRAAARLMRTKADELRSVDNPTATTMARIFYDQADQIMALCKRPGAHESS